MNVDVDAVVDDGNVDNARDVVVAVVAVVVAGIREVEHRSSLHERGLPERPRG